MRLLNSSYSTKYFGSGGAVNRLLGVVSPARLALCLLGLCLVAPAAAETEEAAPLPPCRNEIRLPMVPLKEPRPAEGAEQKFQTTGDKNPTASFIDSLKGNDAAIEVRIGEGRLLTLKSDLDRNQRARVVAVGDPTILDFQILPNPRLIRLVGERPGVTDLSITTVDGETVSFEVHVVYDLELVKAHLLQHFPDTYLKLGQLRENIVVEGQARSPEQVSKIIQVLEDYLASLNPKRESEREQGIPAGMGRGGAQVPPPPNANETPDAPLPPGEAFPEVGGFSRNKVTYVRPEIINLIRVPGVHQVLLKVQVAELNRTALREIGADLLANPQGNIIGTNIAGSGVTADGILGLGAKAVTSTTTAFGIFPSANFEIMIRALRRNQLMSLMAEPNLMAMSGQKASFLAGGQFPVPVAQASGGLGNGTITIVWKDFGVLLNFIPTVLEDETIRLAVAPEVSLLDPTIGTRVNVTSPITPGLNTRRADTTVELRQGQTLAIAGLLSVQLEAETDRIPGLGDLPYIGPLFSNNSNRRVEKELLVMVTPYLVTPMNPDQVPALPGSDIKDPTDCEFYLKNHMVGRTETSYRSTANWNDPLGMVHRMKVEKRCMSGPVGYSE